MVNDPMQSPCCKPLRIIELAVMTVCFSFLFMLRQYNYLYDTVLGSTALIHLFTTYGPLMIILAADIICELLKTPITNIPMILVLVLGAVLCCSTGIALIISRFAHTDCNAFRTLNVMSILAGASWFSTIVFLMDAIIVIRFA